MNLLDYIIEKKQGRLDKKFIYDNIKIIQDTLSKSTKDSILYIDYFTMRLVLKDYENVMEEIDSMQYANNNFSEMYYNEILKDAITEFYESEFTDDLITKKHPIDVDSEIQPAQVIDENY